MWVLHKISHIIILYYVYIQNQKEQTKLSYQRLLNSLAKLGDKLLPGRAEKKIWEQSRKNQEAISLNEEEDTVLVR